MGCEKVLNVDRSVVHQKEYLRELDSPTYILMSGVRNIASPQTLDQTQSVSGFTDTSGQLGWLPEAL